MNEHDSEKLAGILSTIGYTECSNLTNADIILLNTCSVREKSYNKVFTFLGKLKKIKEKNPQLIIGVCGCVAQQEGIDIFKRAAFVDFLIGPRSMASLPDLLEKVSFHRRIMDLEMRNDFASLPYSQFSRKTFPSAYITIMEGCNRACSYCIVPQARGREVCRSFDDIIDEARLLAKTGYMEIELLGQNVNAYKFENKSFIDLLSGLSSVEYLKRIRFTTSHPFHLNADLMQFMKMNRKICNHLHLPVQSGSTKILTLMKRGYSSEEYEEKALWLKKNIKDFTLSTDIIVGFPGEKDSDFQKTIRLVESIKYDQIYSFAYSPRPNTEASLKMVDDLPMKEKMKRLHYLQSRQSALQEKLNLEWTGRIVEVLVEGKSKKSESMLTGRTTNNKIVNFKGVASLTGKLVYVRITDSSTHSLIGEAI